MKIFTIAQQVSGKGKEMKTEYQLAGNVSLLEAQQMFTEAIIAQAAKAKELKNEVQGQVKGG